MNMGRLVFYIAIFVATLAFVVGGVRAARRFRDKRRPSSTELGIGFGVLVAVYLVKSLPLESLRWLVTLVISYAAFAMLRSAARASTAPALGA